MEKNKKVLLISYDGGGLRGYYPAYFLQQFEKDYGVDLFDVADVFAGTSTGSILSVASAIKIDKNTLVDIYKTGGSRLFKLKKFYEKIRCKPFFITNIFLRKELNKQALTALKVPTLKKTFPDLYNYTKKDVMIVTSAIEDDNAPMLFTTPNFDVQDRSTKADYVETIIASSAIPMVFTCMPDNKTYYKDKNINMQDGMMSGNNNPTSIAVQRLIDKGYKKEDIIVLNFGNNGESKEARKIDHNPQQEVKNVVSDLKHVASKSLWHVAMDVATLGLSHFLRTKAKNLGSQLKNDVYEDLGSKTIPPFTSSKNFVDKNYLRITLDSDTIYNALFLKPAFFKDCEDSYKTLNKTVYQFISKNFDIKKK